jgi:hypothetical protein
LRQNGTSDHVIRTAADPGDMFLINIGDPGTEAQRLIKVPAETEIKMEEASYERHVQPGEKVRSLWMT